MAKELQEDSEAFIAEVCWHYYIHGETQAEVARVMGVTRLRINQAIQKAKAMGMVNIKIESPFITRIELQHRLEDQFGIPKALVVPVEPNSTDYHGPVGAGLAHYLDDVLPTSGWEKIGVSWGVALQSTIERLSNQPIDNLEVLALMGGSTAGSSFNAFSIVSGFADKFDASYSHLVAPTYLPHDTDRDKFLAQDVYAEHMKKCQSIDAALLVVGDVSNLSHMVRYGLPNDVNMQELLDAGAVGDMLGRFIDAEGQEIDHPINSRVAGVDLSSLEKVPNKILTAAGSHKVAVIAAVLKRGLVDTLVTDELTAELLLK